MIRHYFDCTKKEKLIPIALLLFLISLYSFGQIPSGYYDNANGKTGYALKTSLHNTIKDHKVLGYKFLWTLYQTSDRKANGKVWDMYSDIPGATPDYEYTFVADQCGNYSGEGSCYNREHSFPQSWFDDASPMKSDPFHVIPSDGFVNGKRGNLAYGEVGGTARYTSSNGSKVGASSYPGYSGQVFEPIDEYKGDLARGFLYMATRYENVIDNWENNNSNGNAMLNGTSDQVYEDWALAMLIAWHDADPVSQKERDRNNVIHKHQNNRNPFIDHPEYVSSIWLDPDMTNPIIQLNTSLADFGVIRFGNVSDTQSYSVSGANLTSPISINSNNGFEISLTDVNMDFTTSLTLPVTSGEISSTTIFVRFKPVSDLNNAVSGVITHASEGVTTRSYRVSGTEYYKIIPEVNFSFSLRNIGPMEMYQVQLFANLAPNEDLTVQIEETSNMGLTYDQQYTTTPAIGEDTIDLTWNSGELNASFLVNFAASFLDQFHSGSVSFSLLDNEAYSIGTNNNFELVLQNNTVIAGVFEDTFSKFKIYPNPTNGRVTIDWASDTYYYSILNFMGKVLKSGYAEQRKTIDVSDLKAGNYILQIADKGSRRTHRLSIY